MEGKNEKQIHVWGGVLATLFLAILFCFASCSNNSSSSSSNADSDDGYSLGDVPKSDKFPNDYFEVKEDCEEGIYLEFQVKENQKSFRVRIDGIGQVAEGVWLNESRDRGAFFYPYLTPGKEYTIRVLFLRDEDKDDDGFVVDYIGDDGTVGWFETKVKAGAKSWGEVRLKDCGEMEIEPNGDFKFTKMPTFEHEENFTKSGHDWILDLALVEGVSWEHESKKTKWSAAAKIPQASLTKTQNLYMLDYEWKNASFEIGFICYRPVLYYEYGGNTYMYLWWSGTKDMPKDLKAEEDLWTDIDITKSADVAKIQGTWEEKYGSGFETVLHEIPLSGFHAETLVIKDNAVEAIYFDTCTKRDGTAFSEKELDILKDYGYKLSSDGKTAIEKYESEEQSLYEYFKEGSHEHWLTKEDVRDCEIHYKLQLFENEKALRIIESHKYDDDSNDYFYDYQKQ